MPLCTSVTRPAYLLCTRQRLQGFAAGVLCDALYIGMDGQFLLRGFVHLVTRTRIWSPTAKRSWASPIQSHARSRAMMEHSTPKISTRIGLVGNSNDAGLYHAPSGRGTPVGIRAEIEKLAFAHHGFAAAGNYTAALGVNAKDNEIDFCAQHIAQQLHLANGHTVSTVSCAGGDHHFFERNDDAEAVVIHNCNRLCRCRSARYRPAMPKGYAACGRRCESRATRRLRGHPRFRFRRRFQWSAPGHPLCVCGGAGESRRAFLLRQGREWVHPQNPQVRGWAGQGKNIIVHFHGKPPIQFQVLL